jgi:hypothetical protein
VTVIAEIQVAPSPPGTAENPRPRGGRDRGDPGVGLSHIKVATVNRTMDSLTSKFR